MLKKRLTIGRFHSERRFEHWGSSLAYASVLKQRSRRTGWLGRVLVIVLGLAVAGLAGAPIAYMLWPGPKAISPDAPSLPITVGGTVFNVPPAAIRVKMQRRPGPQPRIDLNFLWPSLAPPDAAAKPSLHGAPRTIDRLFVTIAASESTLAPSERLKIIYPRYADHGVFGPDGLMIQAFRDGSPYQGEELILDPALPEHFPLRCTRHSGGTPPMCLHERRVGGADITVRFPREWLSDWRSVAAGIDRLLAGLVPALQ
jgi:hypothetical protein